MGNLVTVTSNGREYIIPAQYAKPGAMDPAQMVKVEIAGKVHIIPKQWEQWLVQLAEIIDAEA